MQVIHVHDDDEASPIFKIWLRGPAGILTVSLADLRLLHNYLGSEVGFCYAWLSMYARELWLPAICGISLWVSTIDVHITRTYTNCRIWPSCVFGQMVTEFAVNPRLVALLKKKKLMFEKERQEQDSTCLLMQGISQFR